MFIAAWGLGFRIYGLGIGDGFGIWGSGFRIVVHILLRLGLASLSGGHLASKGLQGNASFLFELLFSSAMPV